MMSSDRVTDRFQEHPLLGPADWVLRGIGQAVLQNNPLSGAVILAGIYYNSPIYGTVCLFGAMIATLTALLLKADKTLVKNGLFGFNGALLALALVAYTSTNFAIGDLPNGYLWSYITLGAAVTAVAVPAFGALLSRQKIPGLTMPFVLTGWCFLAAILQFADIDVSPVIKPTSPADFTGPRPAYAWGTWFYGSFNGVAEIFFQDNWVTGLFIVIGIAINTRLGALMAVLGSTLPIGIAVLYGAHDDAIRDGLFGYNGALTAMALGGLFLMPTAPALLYSVIGVLISAVAWASIGIFLEPTGMPVLTSAFVFTTWLMLLAHGAFTGLVAVPPGEATTPEDNLRRLRDDQKK